VEPLQRLIIAINSFCESKRALVHEFGIGEEAPLTLFVWEGDQLGAIAQCTPRLNKLEQERFEAISHAAFMFRGLVATDAFTVVSEGLRCLSRTEVPLLERFASGDPEVEECVVGSHWESRTALIGSIPYKYGLHRVVEFGPTKIGVLPSGGAYSEMMTLVLNTSSESISVPSLDTPGLKIWFANG
jgi:hypothetical protein